MGEANEVNCFTTDCTSRNRWPESSASGFAPIVSCVSKLDSLSHKVASDCRFFAKHRLVAGSLQNARLELDMFTKCMMFTYP